MLKKKKSITPVEKSKSDSSEAGTGGAPQKSCS